MKGSLPININLSLELVFGLVLMFGWSWSLGLVPTPGYSREIANGGATGACDSDWPR